MKALFLKSSVLLFPLLLAGCGPKTEELEVLSTVVVGPEYSANKGIFIPDDTRRSLGLKVVDVSEETLVARTDFSLRIYGYAGGIAHASGTVTAAQAAALQPGQSVEVETVGNKRATGRVAAIRREMEKLSGAPEVLVEFPGHEGVEVGSFVTAHVAHEGAGPVATVPRSSLVETTEGPFVYTESGDHFVRTAVKIGARNSQFVEIVDGLYAGDRVVAEPAMSLWLTELAAIKGGHACCAVPAKGK